MQLGVRMVEPQSGGVIGCIVPKARGQRRLASHLRAPPLALQHRPRESQRLVGVLETYLAIVLGNVRLLLSRRFLHQPEKMELPVVDDRDDLLAIDVELDLPPGRPVGTVDARSIVVTPRFSRSTT